MQIMAFSAPWAAWATQCLSPGTETGKAATEQHRGRAGDHTARPIEEKQIWL